jgi:hypothetical protein
VRPEAPTTCVRPGNEVSDCPDADPEPGGHAEVVATRPSRLPGFAATATPVAPTRRRIGPGLVAVAAAVLLAGVAGFVVGRATEAGGGPVPAASWRALPPAPIAGRLGPGAVWTGSRMLVWGGSTRGAQPGPAADGAAYDPVARAWRKIPTAPSGVRGGGASGVAWTGDAMLVWASNSPDGPVGAAAYDPSSDSWRRLPAGPLGRREGYGTAWTGTELIVVGGNLGDTLARPLAAALDPKTGSWRALPALDRVTGLMPGPGVVWHRGELFVLGTVCLGGGATDCSQALLAYDPSTDRLRRIDLAGAPIVPEQQLSLLGSSGGELVLSIVGVPTNVNSGRLAIVRYDPARGRWTKGAFAPFPATSDVYQQTAWLGDRVIAADGSSGLQIFDLATGGWETITPGPSPLNARAGSAIVWTGNELIAWSGTVYEHFNPAPADGASLMLSR